MKRTVLGLVASAWVFCVLGSAQAEPITFTFDFTASGTLGGTAFTDAAVNITVTADTLAVVSCGSGVFSVDSSTADIAISGFPTVSVLTATRLFDNNSVGALGFSQASCSGSDYLDIVNAAFMSYALMEPLGPIFDPSPFAVGQFNNVSTTGGILNVNTAQDVTFNAVTGCGPEGGTPIAEVSASSPATGNVRGIVSGVFYDLSE